MDVFFKRKQYTGFNTSLHTAALNFGSITKVYFQLNAKIELNEEEEALVKKYQLKDATIINLPQPTLLRRAIMCGILVGFIGYIVFGRTYFDLWGAGPTGLLGAFVYYHLNRKTIYLRDLLHGRTFRCKSVVALVETETWLQSALGYVRQVIETAKHWDGTEKREIEPLSAEEAKKAVRPRMHSLEVDIV